MSHQLDLEDPVQLFTRFFDNASFVKTLEGIFDKQARGQFQGQALNQNDEPINSQFSIDEAPQIKGILYKFYIFYFSDSAIPTFEWKTLLLGPSGLLTSIFNEFKERHKAELGKIKPNVPQADLSPGKYL
jgi:hypothetical protein